MTAPRAPSERPPTEGESRSLAGVTARFVATLGAYWPLWLFRAYSTLGRRAPAPTRIGAGAAAGLVLVPFVNVLWLAYLAVDLPRSVRRLRAGPDQGPDPEVLSILLLAPVAGAIALVAALDLHPVLAGYVAWPLELPAALALERALARIPGPSTAALGRERETVFTAAIAIAAWAVLGVALIDGDEDERSTAAPQPVPEVSDLAVTRDAVWVTNTVRGTVLKLDPRTGRRVAPPIRVGREPLDIAAGDGGVWVANYVSGTVVRIDQETNRVARPIRTGRGPFGIEVTEGAVWVSNQVERTVARIDPADAEVAGQPVTVGRGPRGVAVGEGAVWVANGEGKSVSRVVPGSERARHVRLGRLAHDVAVGGESVWVTLPETGVVRRIDPQAVTPRGGSITVPAGPGSIEFGLGSVWVASESGTVTRLEPRTGRLQGAPIEVGGRIADLTVAEGAVWVLRSDGRVRRIPVRARG